jgi:hypothetical protein
MAASYSPLRIMGDATANTMVSQIRASIQPLVNFVYNEMQV